MQEQQLTKKDKKRDTMEREMAGEITRYIIPLLGAAPRNLEELKEECVENLSPHIRKLEEFLKTKKRSGELPAIDVIQIDSDKKGKGQRSHAKREPILEREKKSSIESGFRKCWYEIRKKMNMSKQEYAAYYLTHLAQDERLLGRTDCWNLSFQFLGNRRLIADFDKVMKLGLDNYLRIFGNIFYGTYMISGRYLKKKAKSQENEKSPESNPLKEIAAQVAILLMSEGIPYNCIRYMRPENFDFSKRIVFINTGRSYRIWVLPIEKIAMLEARFKKLSFWFRIPKDGISKKFDELFRGSENLVRFALAREGKKLGLPKGAATIENFRNTAIYDKYVHGDISPAIISSVLGPEITYNVIAPRHIYSGYCPPVFRNHRKKIGNIMPNEYVVKMQLADDLDIKTANDCQDLLNQYVCGAKRDDILKKLQKIQINKNSDILGFVGYMLEQQTGGKYLDSDSVFRYFMSIKELYVKGVIKNSREITDDDIMSVISQEHDNIIDYNAFRMLRTSVNHYVRYLRSAKRPVQNIRWGRFQKYVERSCRLIVLPSPEETKKKVDALLSQKGTVRESVAYEVMMAQQLGLRISEIEGAELTKVRRLGKDENGVDEDYLEIIGKGSKPRRVLLGHLGADNRRMLESYIGRQKARNNTAMFDESKINQIANEYHKDFIDIAPNGIHSYRHKYATDKIIGNENILDISSSLGHETVRVTHNTYDQSAYLLMKDRNNMSMTDRAIITQKEMSAFLQMSEAGVKKLKKNNAFKFKMVKGKVSKKNGESKYYVDYEDVINKLWNNASKRTEKISLEQREKALWEQYYKRRRVSKAK